MHATPVFCLFSLLHLGVKVRSFWIHTRLRQTNSGAAACLEVVYGKPGEMPLPELTLADETGRQWDAKETGKGVRGIGSC